MIRGDSLKRDVIDGQNGDVWVKFDVLSLEYTDRLVWYVGEVKGEDGFAGLQRSRIVNIFSAASVLFGKQIFKVNN